MIGEEEKLLDDGGTVKVKFGMDYILCNLPS